MALYAGMDLHSRNTLVGVIDSSFKRVFEKRVPNDLSLIVDKLEPFGDRLAGIVVESTYGDRDHRAIDDTIHEFESLVKAAAELKGKETSDKKVAKAAAGKGEPSPPPEHRCTASCFSASTFTISVSVSSSPLRSSTTTTKTPSSIASSTGSRTDRRCISAARGRSCSGRLYGEHWSA